MNFGYSLKYIQVIKVRIEKNIIEYIQQRERIQAQLSAFHINKTLRDDVGDDDA